MNTKQLTELFTGYVASYGKPAVQRWFNGWALLQAKQEEKHQAYVDAMSDDEALKYLEIQEQAGQDMATYNKDSVDAQWNVAVAIAMAMVSAA